MFSVRSGWIRVAAGAVAGVSCLAATACSSGNGGGASAASPTASTSNSGTPDPLAAVPASKVVAEAKADAKAAPSLAVAGTLSQQGQRDAVDLGIRRGQGCSGTVGMAGQGTVRLTMIGKTMYLNPDKQFLTVAAGSAARAETVIGLVNGKYLELPASDKNTAGMAAFCDPGKLLDQGTPVTFTRGAVSMLDGVQVLAIKVSDGSTEYVTDTIRPQFVEVTAPRHAKVGAVKLTFSVGAPVTLAVPPAAKVIDGTMFGL